MYIYKTHATGLKIIATLLPINITVTCTSTEDEEGNLIGFLRQNLDSRDQALLTID
jgi:hypothetical protein